MAILFAGELLSAAIGILFPPLSLPGHSEYGLANLTMLVVGRSFGISQPDVASRKCAASSS
jgi:hypothetical protein